MQRCKTARNKLASVKTAPVKSARNKLALIKTAPVKSASTKLARTKLALVKTGGFPYILFLSNLIYLLLSGGIL